MSAAAAALSLQIVRLEQFFVAIRSLSSVNSAHGCSSRLERFFGQFRCIRAVAEPQALASSRSPLTADALRKLVERLKVHLERARARGEFIDVWAVSGLGRKEVRNASVLAWLLDPQGSHGQHAACLKALMARVNSHEDAWRLDSSALEKANVQVEQRPLGSVRDRVDIAIDSPDFIIFIEVKIDAVEGDQQLLRYTQAIAAKALARAGSMGRKPQTMIIYVSREARTDSIPGLVQLNWHDIAETLIEVANRSEGVAGFIIRSFATHIRKFN